MSLEYILLSLGISLILTIFLELLFAIVFRIKGRALLVVALANLLTNPAVVMLFLLLCRHYSLPEIAVVPFLETGAILIEALIFAKCTDIKRPFLFSLAINAISYLSGILADVLL